MFQTVFKLSNLWNQTFGVFIRVTDEYTVGVQLDVAVLRLYRTSLVCLGAVG